MPPEPDTAALLERYASVARLTAALREALEADQLDRLAALGDERAAALAAAEAGLADLVSSGAPLPPKTLGALRSALGEAVIEDERLRALLVSRAHELPRQLAELRGARAGLGGYQAAIGDVSDRIDRRG